MNALSLLFVFSQIIVLLLNIGHVLAIRRQSLVSYFKQNGIDHASRLMQCHVTSGTTSVACAVRCAMAEDCVAHSLDGASHCYVCNVNTETDSSEEFNMFDESCVNPCFMYLKSEYLNYAAVAVLHVRVQ